MKSEQLKKLSKFTTISFALWPLDLKGTKEFHSRIIILGLNPSAEIKFGENFHTGKRFDIWYEKGFSKYPFKGAILTDLMSHHEPDSRLVIKEWKKKDHIFKNKHTKKLQEQLKILGTRKDTPILCIGKSTENLFSQAFPEFKRVFYINHPNSYRMKNNQSVFLKDLKKLGEKITQ
jgi:hypothetical protein